LKTKFYYRRDDFNFPIVNFPVICSNISAASAYEVVISQSIDILNIVFPIIKKKHLAFHFFYCERTRWRLFQKRVVCT